LFFCDSPAQPAALEESSNIFHKYVEEVKRKSGLVVEGQTGLLQATFSRQLGGMSIPPSSNFSNWPEELRNIVVSTIRRNWSFNEFDSIDEADAFLTTVSGAKLVLSFNIGFCTKLGERPPAKTGIEVYRTS
jgi:hypothetical protein